MKFSIVTVCYNSANTIRDTFESVLNQTFSDVEYIVIDGNSNDETVSIIKKYEIKFNGKMRWISEPDKGLYDAMNKGIRMATGDVIGILNSDDYYASNTVLATVVEVMEKRNIDSCYGDLLYIKNEKPYRYWRANIYHSFKLGWMPPHPAFFVKKSIYEKYGSFRLDCGSAADYELLLRFFEKEKISAYWINELLVKMRAGGISNDGPASRLYAYNNDRKSWEVNNITPYFFTFFLKRIQKIPQYIFKHNIK